MIRPKKPFFLVVILCIGWIATSYIFWIRHEGNGPRIDLQYNKLPAKLDRLELDIQREHVAHDRLVHKLLYAVRTRDEIAARSSSVAAPSSMASPTESDNYIKEIRLVTTTVDDLPSMSQNNISAIRTSAGADDNFQGPVIPVLVFACNRVSVRKCLDNLIGYRPNVHQFPIIVSQVG